MKNPLCLLCALVIVAVVSSDALARGGRGGGNMGMVCNNIQTVAAAPLPTPATATNLQQTAANRLVKPATQCKAALDVAPAFAIDATALQALNVRKTATEMLVVK